MIILNMPKFQDLDNKVRLVSDITFGNDAKELWFQFDPEFKNLIAHDTLDSFVVAVLSLAITTGQDIHVKGVISSKLFYNLSHSLIPILSDYFKCDRISIKADNITQFTPNKKPGYTAITGFSAGVDSFLNYYDHSGDRVSEEFQISHFVYNNVGSHGQHGSDKDNALFTERFMKTKEYAEKENIPFIPISSNMDDMLNSNFQKTHTLRNTATALLMQTNIGKFYYASGYAFSEIKLGPHHDTAIMDPIILPLLSTERMQCISTGSERSRVEKTNVITNLPLSYQYLDVCVLPTIAPKNRTNCAVCWKCLRTEMTLFLFGKLDNYSPVFQTEDFERFKNMYLIYVLAAKDPLTAEIKELLKQTGYKVPVSVKILGFILPNILSKQIVRVIPKIRNANKLVTLINLLLKF